MGVIDSIRNAFAPRVESKPLSAGNYISRDYFKTESVPEDKARTPAPRSYQIGGNKVPHSIDVSLYENAYDDVPLCADIVDTLTDLIVGPGIYIESENETIDEWFTDWMRDVDFELTLEPMCRTSLWAGFGSSEILWDGPNKTIAGFQMQDPKYMYKMRKQRSLVNEGYLYDDMEKQVEFKTSNVWWTDFRLKATAAYGSSIFRPIIASGKEGTALYNKLSIEKNMGILMKRKANAPIHVKLGPLDKPPSADDIQQVTAGMEVMGGKTEWVTSMHVEMAALDIGGKIINPTPFLDHYERQIKFAGGLPDVYLGYGNIAEGLAKEQGDALSMRIKSYRAQLSRSMMQQIFKPLALLNGFAEYPKIKWEVATPAQEKEKLEMLTKLMGPQSQISPYTRLDLEKQTRSILGIIEPLPDDAIDYLKPQPVVVTPPADTQEPSEGYAFECFDNKVAESWNMMPFILQALKQGFPNLEGLTKAQNNLALEILLSGLENKRGPREIAQILAKKIYGGDMDKAMLVSRTEFARAENAGALKAYAASGRVDRVEWLVHEDQRTCELCGPHNGEVFNLGSAPKLPLHPRCRCRTVPVIRS